MVGLASVKSDRIETRNSKYDWTGGVIPGMIGYVEKVGFLTPGRNRGEHSMAASTEEVLNHHLQAFGEGNMEEVLADYTEDSILCTQDGVLEGLNEIRPLFESFFAEFAKPGASFGMDTQTVKGELAFIVWHAETADRVIELGTDTFIVRGGKIVAQTFAAKSTAKS